MTQNDMEKEWVNIREWELSLLRGVSVSGMDRTIEIIGVVNRIIDWVYLD